MGTEKKTKKGSKVILIVIAVVFGFLLVSGSVFAGYYFATKNAATMVTQGNKTSEKESENGEEVTLELDEFLVNLADEGKPRYLKLKIFIGYNTNEDFAKELEVKKPIIRDTFNNVLRTKKTNDIIPSGEEALKKALLDKVNELLKSGKVTNVYFSEILVQ